MSTRPDLTDQLRKAVQLHRLGELGKAERLYRSTLARNPFNADARNFLGVLAMQQGKSEQAEFQFRSALSTARSPAILNNYGRLLRRLKRPLEALECYEEALGYIPDSAGTLCNRGLALADLGRLEAAVESYDRALAIAPGDVRAWSNRGLALANLHHDDAALLSYDKALEIEPENVKVLSNRGVLLAGLGRSGEALECYDRALATKPEDADLLANRGLVLTDLGRHRDALESYDRALKRRPRSTGLLLGRGLTLTWLKRHEEALQTCDQALASQPDNVEMLSLRGVALAGLGRFAEAVASYDKALAFQLVAARPGFAKMLSNRGIALYELGHRDEALESYARAIALRTDYAEAHWNEAICRLTGGDFAAGWTKYEWRWRMPAFDKYRHDFHQELWLGGEDIVGRTILLHAEQGLGDTLQFCRYAGVVIGQGARVVLQVQPPLVSLLGDRDDGVRVIGWDSVPEAFDVHCPLLSLPLALGTRLATIPSEVPYIRAPAGKAAVWRERLRACDGLRVGIAWSGNPGHGNDHNRSIALARLVDMFIPGMRPVSLQTAMRSDDRATLTQHPEILDFADALDDFSDTAALMQELDVIVSVDTSVAHLAGALGKPVSLLLPFRADWRWLLDREDSPWYPTMRLYRQPAPGDWGTVIARLRADLAHLRQAIHPAS